MPPSPTPPTISSRILKAGFRGILVYGILSAAMTLLPGASCSFICLPDWSLPTLLGALPWIELLDSLFKDEPPLPLLILVAAASYFIFFAIIGALVVGLRSISKRLPER